MANPLTRTATFRQMSAKAVVQQLDGVERPYPVYYLGRTIKFERPESPGQTYRWALDNPTS